VRGVVVQNQVHPPRLPIRSQQLGQGPEEVVVVVRLEARPAHGPIDHIQGGEKGVNRPGIAGDSMS
jgi:hypothetical protein